MQQYHDLVEKVLRSGNYRKNRTDADTLSTFSQFYRIDLQEGFPLLKTKDLSGYRWNSLIHELLWYFSGEHHIRNLREETKIWDAWADEDWNLPTAYGRFWRRYPVPQESARLEGEQWPDRDTRWVSEEDGNLVVDQLRYVIDTLRGENPNRSPYSRRLVVTPWHPANAEVSDLPPCHAMFVMNVQDGKLNTHLTQRSGDIGLGIPFNIAAYSLITKIIAKQTDFEVGEFAHTIVDAHIYCGKGGRGLWYDKNISELGERVSRCEDRSDYLEVRDWILENAPDEDGASPEDDEYGYDHVPGLLKQLSRESRPRPSMKVAEKPIDDLEYDDFDLEDYNPHPGIKFSVAE
ncbi:MAG: thymidylate synthase [Candidatus Nanohaloarchaea archaeon]